MTFRWGDSYGDFLKVGLPLNFITGGGDPDNPGQFSVLTRRMKRGLGGRPP